MLFHVKILHHSYFFFGKTMPLALRKTAAVDTVCKSVWCFHLNKISKIIDNKFLKYFIRILTKRKINNLFIILSLILDWQ